jgi:hypothetical protein
MFKNEGKYSLCGEVEEIWVLNGDEAATDRKHHLLMHTDDIKLLLGDDINTIKHSIIKS